MVLVVMVVVVTVQEYVLILAGKDTRRKDIHMAGKEERYGGKRCGWKRYGGEDLIFGLPTPITSL